MARIFRISVLLSTPSTCILVYLLTTKSVTCPLALNDLFVTCGKDTPNTMKDRDMTFRSVARFLILDPEGFGERGF